VGVDDTIAPAIELQPVVTALYDPGRQTLAHVQGRKAMRATIPENAGFTIPITPKHQRDAGDGPLKRLPLRYFPAPARHVPGISQESRSAVANSTFHHVHLTNE
jgi:hypothetical protein